jgi:hypothetical protein
MKTFHKLGILMLGSFFLMGVMIQNPHAASQMTKKTVQPNNKAATLKKTMKHQTKTVLKKTKKKKHKIILKKAGKTLKKPFPTPKGAGDPDLRAELISATPLGDGRVQITGRITNIGGGNFVSGAGQAAAQIVLLLPHLTGPDSVPIIQSLPILRLNTRASMTISGSFRVQ